MDGTKPRCQDSPRGWIGSWKTCFATEHAMEYGMDYERERQEAIYAGRCALESLREARNEISKAKNWGLLDILGGGFVSTLMKHSKVNNAKSCMERARYDLRRFNSELRDLHLDVNMEIGDILTFFDFMDSFLADILVQSRLNNAANEIDRAIRRVQNILNSI